MTLHRWIEIGALGSLVGIFFIIPIYAPQGVDFFAVAFFLLGSLLIDQRDIDAASWAGRRPFVFACAAVILAIPFGSAVCSVNGFASQVGSGVYLTAAPPALFLVAAKARFNLIGQDGVKRLILAAIYIGLIPATIYALTTFATPPRRFYLPGQAALNITAIYLSCVSVITLVLTVNLDWRRRMLSYVVFLALTTVGLLTASRTFLVSAALVLGVYAIVIRRRKTLLREMAMMTAVVAAILAASSLAFQGSLARLLKQQPLGFLDGRLDSWADSWTLFRKYPWCGIGPSTFHSIVLNPLYAERVRDHIRFYPFYHAHNILLNTLAEGGVIVGALLVVLVAATIFGCYTILKNNPEAPFGLIAAALLTIFLVVGLFENTLVRPVLFPLAILLGLGMNVTWRAPLEAKSPG